MEETRTEINVSKKVKREDAFIGPKTSKSSFFSRPLIVLGEFQCELNGIRDGAIKRKIIFDESRATFDILFKFICLMFNYSGAGDYFFIEYKEKTKDSEEAKGSHGREEQQPKHDQNSEEKSQMEETPLVSTEGVSIFPQAQVKTKETIAFQMEMEESQRETESIQENLFTMSIISPLKSTSELLKSNLEGEEVMIAESISISERKYTPLSCLVLRYLTPLMVPLEISIRKLGEIPLKSLDPFKTKAKTQPLCVLAEGFSLSDFREELPFYDELLDHYKGKSGDEESRQKAKQLLGEEFNENKADLPQINFLLGRWVLREELSKYKLLD